uniref:Uncharacterized protein n=1 Tax=Melopsittacus undulatus TaxID=13146 RepID=A0A8V5GRG9_MELUD
IALGVLARKLGPYRRAVMFFSKQLDEASKVWPRCLRAVAAVVMNVQEARKFTLGQNYCANKTNCNSCISAYARF